MGASPPDIACRLASSTSPLAPTLRRIVIPTKVDGAPFAAAPVATVTASPLHAVASQHFNIAAAATDDLPVRRIASSVSP
jgi:hypothetical protein